MRSIWRWIWPASVLVLAGLIWQAAPSQVDSAQVDSAQVDSAQVGPSQEERAQEARAQEARAQEARAQEDRAQEDLGQTNLCCGEARQPGPSSEQVDFDAPQGTKTDLQQSGQEQPEGKQSSSDQPELRTAVQETVQRESSGTSQLRARPRSILEIVRSDDRLSRLAELVETAGVDGTLSSTADVTLFAPTNEAFEKLPAGTLQALKENPEQLTAVLNQHIVLGRQSSANWAQQPELTSLGGKTLRASPGHARVASAVVTQPDVMAEDGVLHLIDSVFVPPPEPSFTPPLLILAVGLVMVVGCILLLRLPAFLALILAALVVSSMAGTGNIQEYASEAAKINARRAAVQEGGTLDLQDREVQLSLAEKAASISASLNSQSPIERVTNGFGGTCASLGVLIAMAAIVGKTLVDSGAAERIVRSALWLFGEARASVAFASSGYLLSIPVFFDTVFYLMLPLARSLRAKTGRNYLLYIMAIAAGGTVTHSMVPPTPGPVVAADILSVPLGGMILGGCLVGCFSVAAGLGFSHWVNRRMDLPLRDTPETTLADLEEQSARADKHLPPLWLSLLPIVLPILLVGGKALIPLTVLRSWSESMQYTVDLLGDPDVALSISALIGVFTLVINRGPSRDELRASLQSALTSAGSIILITAAGGAFGAVLKQSAIGPTIGSLATTYSLPPIPLAFFLTTLVRAAQGSATVAMITAAGILAGSINSQVLSPLWVALAIGCGAAPLSWMNDSGFWIVGKMSGMTEEETLRSWTPLLSVMGLVGGAVVWILATLMPTLPAWFGGT